MNDPLECCIKEALRLYPSVPIIGRQIEQDTYIDGKPVLKGTSLVILIHLLHRNPLIWDRPEEFIPERFLESRYRLANANVDFDKNMLLLKKPQFPPNPYETLTQ